MCTPAASTVKITLMTGPTTAYPKMARIMPIMPAEKLVINISKPAGICPSIFSSNFLMQKPPSGPITMAAISIVMDVSLIIAPMTAMAPTTRPLSPPTILPPVDAIRIGIKYVSIGETMLLSCLFGIQPVSINSAARKPNAISAPIFGITMPDRNLPNFCTLFFMSDLSYPVQQDNKRYNCRL